MGEMPSRRQGFAAELFPVGDHDRLGKLLAELEPRLGAVALRITKHPESARDVLQSAFEKAIRHGGAFQGRARVSTWLYRIVANEALMWLRTQRRRGELRGQVDPLELARIADPGPGPAERLQQRERAERLHAGLGLLPAAERDVMLRCALADESYAEYSARTGAHPAAVKSRAHRARRRLGLLLSESAS